MLKLSIMLSSIQAHPYSFVGSLFVAKFVVVVSHCAGGRLPPAQIFDEFFSTHNYLLQGQPRIVQDAEAASPTVILSCDIQWGLTYSVGAAFCRPHILSSTLLIPLFCIQGLDQF
ncbi:MAG: hypothetical protein FWE22_04275 [Firmicutes bacterium]|nr:hypothetical protein [Bacillota bacterium]